LGGIEANLDRACASRSPRTARRQTSEEGGMKILLTAALIALAFVTYATPAAAYVVAVPMSVAASTIADDADLTAAIRSAVDDVLSHAIAFSPTFVTVQTARVIGGRVYILLLI
jgi:hypothetical protein